MARHGELSSKKLVMSGFEQALRALPRWHAVPENLLTEIERQLAEREMDAVSLLKRERDTPAPAARQSAQRDCARFGSG